MYLFFPRRRLYFSEITILVPRSWTTYTAPDVIQSERFETSDIIIDVSQEERPDRPFTNKDSGCGQPGRYIHFTPNFMKSDAEAEKYGGYGRVCRNHENVHNLEDFCDELKFSSFIQYTFFTKIIFNVQKEDEAKVAFKMHAIYNRILTLQSYCFLLR